ncbi:response regulator transcription factor [Virgibacillus sp. NKC19-16]|uniref:response regulator transcription factor n=1 Tax=Virgibacillus salidurans TaxID=2831673 RepID=UPI001F2D8F37|nr:response regulator transcription factor [Virgibacillus sp. NKC19-16]UJL45824.1 response regulator transcription factor [Virgibacillus sp. NKC19-16]
MIEIMIVENQRLLREGVEAIIDQTNDIRVMETAENGETAIQKIKETQIDVVLMDSHMPDMDGIVTMVYLKEKYPLIKVIMLTEDLEEDFVITGINAGVDAFLYKNLYADTLTQTIRATYRCDIVLSGKIAQIITAKIWELTFDREQLLAKRLEIRGYKFTKRELDIMYLLKNRYTNQQIAEEILLGVGTIKNYISGIYDKLNVQNRKEAIDLLRLLERNK